MTRVPDDIKRNVRAVLLSKVGGVSTCEFLKDYKTLLLEPLSLADLGFSKVEDFLKAIPDVARLTKSGKIFGVSEPNTYLPIGARKAQGNLPKDYHQNLLKGTKNKCETSPSHAGKEGIDAMDCEYVPDHRGLYSVCVELSKLKLRSKDKIAEVFNEVGDVKDIYVNDQRAFIRYESIKECERSVEQFSHYDVQMAKRNCGKDKKSPAHVNGFGQADHHSQAPQEKSKPVNRNNRPSRKNGKQNGSKTPLSRDMKGNTTEVFVGNINSEGEFKEAIKHFPVVNSRIRFKNGNIFAFLNVPSIKDARYVIGNLRSKMPLSKQLVVDFQKNKEKIGDETSADESVSSKSGSSDYGPSLKGKKKPQTQTRNPVEMPDLESDYVNMPALVSPHDSENQSNQSDLNCSVFVGNFHNTATSKDIREAFSDFNVDEVIMVNTDLHKGCTKAFVKLKTPYDVVRAVKDMSGTRIKEWPIKVAVHFNNAPMSRLVQELVPSQIK